MKIISDKLISIPGFWMACFVGGWVAEIMKNEAISAFNYYEVKAETDLGNNK